MFARVKRLGGSLALITALCIAFMLGTWVGVPVQTAHSQPNAQADTQTLIDLYKRVIPSVVSIQVRVPTSASDIIIPQDDPHQNLTPPPFSEGDGSGFIYSDEGYIITNSHVVQDADRIQVTFADDITLTAKVVGIDRDSDLAVIKVETDKSRLIPVKLADADTVQIGQHVVAIGNPFGYGGSMSQGIISGLNRRLDSQAVNNGNPFQIPGMIQTDTAINPGNSGGPLFSLDGQVVGVNTAIESRVRQSSGVGFAVPSNLVRKFGDLLIKNGKVEHSFLGIAGGDLTVNLNELMSLDANQRGVLVSRVTEGSPAAAAGIKASTVQKKLDGETISVGGDVIIAIDKVPVRHFEDLLGYLFTKTEVGQTVTLTVLRDGKQIDVPVILQVRPK